MAWERTSRHSRGYGAAWDKLRAAILARDLRLCQPCQALGRITAASQVDHIKPKAKGGTDSPDNLQAICKACHDDKTARESAESQGRTYKPRPRIGIDGWPIEPR